MVLRPEPVRAFFRRSLIAGENFISSPAQNAQLKSDTIGVVFVQGIDAFVVYRVDPDQEQVQS